MMMRVMVLVMMRVMNKMMMKPPYQCRCNNGPGVDDGGGSGRRTALWLMEPPYTHSWTEKIRPVKCFCICIYNLSWIYGPLINGTALHPKLDKKNKTSEVFLYLYQYLNPYQYLYIVLNVGPSDEWNLLSRLGQKRKTIWMWRKGPYVCKRKKFKTVF